MSSSSVELRQLLARLQGYQVPTEYLTNDKENNNEQHEDETQFDTSLIVKYEQARDLYLQRRVERALIDRLKTFNGNSFETPTVPTLDEHDTLKLARERSLKEVQDKVKLINDKQLELRATYNRFQSKRTGYEQALSKLESSQNRLADLKSSNHQSLVVDNKFPSDVTDADVTSQKQRLLELQTRRNELEEQLRSIKKDNEETKASFHKKLENMNEIQKDENVSEIDISTSTLEKLQERNAETQLKLDQVKESKAFYDNLRLLLEDFGGIILRRVDKSVPTDDSCPVGMMNITIEILKKYELVIKLLPNNVNCEQYTELHSVELLGDPTITGTVLDESGQPTLQITIPDMNDIVRASKNRHHQNDSLAFVVREMMARIMILEKRVEILSNLQEMVLTKIGKLYHDQDNNSSENSSCFGESDQEVICSLNEEQVSVLLRLTPDCPFVMGSVYIDQLVGLGGWEQDVLDQMKDRVHAEKFDNPITLIQYLQKEIQKEKGDSGLLPRTPSLPQRK